MQPSRPKTQELNSEGDIIPLQRMHPMAIMRPDLPAFERTSQEQEVEAPTDDYIPFEDASPTTDIEGGNELGEVDTTP
eukprot:2809977-Ditylum_brightwellii.AAC.1